METRTPDATACHHQDLAMREGETDTAYMASAPISPRNDNPIVVDSASRPAGKADRVTVLTSERAPTGAGTRGRFRCRCRYGTSGALPLPLWTRAAGARVVHTSVE